MIPPALLTTGSVPRSRSPGWVCATRALRLVTAVLRVCTHGIYEIPSLTAGASFDDETYSNSRLAMAMRRTKVCWI